MENSSELQSLIPDPTVVSPKGIIASYATALTGYIDKLRETGRKIPESRSHWGCAHTARIGKEIGIPIWAFGEPVVRACLNEGIAELGLSFFEPIVDPKGLTYQHLLDAGSNWRADELKEAPSPDQQLYNTKTALRKFMGGIEKKQVRELGISDVIGLELQEEFPARGLIWAEADEILAPEGTGVSHAELSEVWVTGPLSEKRLVLVGSLSYARVKEQFAALWPKLNLGLFIPDRNFYQKGGDPYASLLKDTDPLHTFRSGSEAVVAREVSAHIHEL